MEFQERNQTDNPLNTGIESRTSIANLRLIAQCCDTLKTWRDSNFGPPHSCQLTLLASERIDNLCQQFCEIGNSSSAFIAAAKMMNSADIRFFDSLESGIEQFIYRVALVSDSLKESKKFMCEKSASRTILSPSESREMSVRRSQMLDMGDMLNDFIRFDLKKEIHSELDLEDSISELDAIGNGTIDPGTWLNSFLVGLESKIKLVDRTLSIIMRNETKELRKEIRSGHYSKVLPILEASSHTTHDSSCLETLLDAKPPSCQHIRWEEDCVPYSPTPLRNSLPFIKALNLCPEDTFIDLGSGMSYMPILINLLTPANSVGIEFQELLANAGKKLIHDLNLARTQIFYSNVVDADFQRGTVFYMFNPFVGKIREAVFEKLQDLALLRAAVGRTIRIATLAISELNFLPWLREIGNYSGTRVYDSSPLLGTKI